MKKIFAALVAAALLMLGGCGGKPETEGKKELDVRAVYDTIVADTKLLPMEEYSADDIKVRFGVQPEDYTQIVAAYAEDPYFSDFVFICVPSDNDAADKIVKKLQNTKNYKDNEWRDYTPNNPENYEAVKRSEIVKKSGVVYYVIAADDAAVVKIIEDALK